MARKGAKTLRKHGLHLGREITGHGLPATFGT